MNGLKPPLAIWLNHASRLLNQKEINLMLTSLGTQNPGRPVLMDGDYQTSPSFASQLKFFGFFN